MKESDSDHVFHFTRSIENLTSIIRNEEFWVCYSLESFDFLNDSNPLNGQILLENGDHHEDEGVINASFAYPITCFCDIPLDNRILNHANEKNDGYGQFGIGMKKSWAEKMRLAPVHYVPANSGVAKLWYDIFVEIPNMRYWTKECGNFDFFFDNLISLGTYIKPYKNDEGKIYYDEREWRYYPPIEEFGKKREKKFLMESIYYEAKHENRLKSTFELTFSIDKDVDYIIVPERYESEINSLINDRKIEIILYEKIGKITSFNKY